MESANLKCKILLLNELSADGLSNLRRSREKCLRILGQDPQEGAITNQSGRPCEGHVGRLRRERSRRAKSDEVDGAKSIRRVNRKAIQRE